MQKFDTPAPISAVLNIPAGHVRFIAADRVDTTVEVRPANASKDRDVKAAERTTVDYRDGVLRIEAPKAKSELLGPSGALEVTVQLPAGSRVDATAAAAEFRGVGRLGEVSIDGAHGSVKFDEVAGARLALLAGDALVGRLDGPAEITSGKGDLRVTEATGGTVTPAHRTRRDLRRGRRRRLGLAGRLHLLRPDPQLAQERRGRRRPARHQRHHRLRRHHRPQPLTP